MKFSLKKISSPKLICGLKIRTTNQNFKAQKDIGLLWQKFYEKKILTKIPHKVSDQIYAVYFEYESDHTAPYSCLLGCEVNPLEPLEKKFHSVIIPAGDYTQIPIEGGPHPEKIGQTWMQIWDAELERSYKVDFEEYNFNLKVPSATIYLS